MSAFRRCWYHVVGCTERNIAGKPSGALHAAVEKMANALKPREERWNQNRDGSKPTRSRSAGCGLFHVCLEKSGLADGCQIRLASSSFIKQKYRPWGEHERRPSTTRAVSGHSGVVLAVVLPCFVTSASAQDMKIAKTDLQVDALDREIKLFLREEMTEGNSTFTDDNVILFLHSATGPPRPAISTLPTRTTPDRLARFSKRSGSSFSSRF